METEDSVQTVISSRSRGVTHCPSCRRYTGPFEVCWYCRYRIRKRPIVRLIKYGSVVGAIIGLFILQQIGAHIGTPHVTISEITRTYNFASIQISGIVQPTVRFYPVETEHERPSGTIVFEVDDGTGLIKVKAYEGVTKEMVQTRKIPSPGDRVRLTGTLHIKGNKISMILGSAAYLTIEREKPATHTPIREIAHADEDSFKNLQRITAYGNVKRTRSSTSSFTITLGDQYDNEIDVVFPWSLLELHEVRVPGENAWVGAPRKGQYLEVSGVLLESTEYGGKRVWKLYPSSPDDIKESSREICNDKNAYRDR